MNVSYYHGGRRHSVAVEPCRSLKNTRQSRSIRFNGKMMTLPIFIKNGVKYMAFHWSVMGGNFMFPIPMNNGRILTYKLEG